MLINDESTGPGRKGVLIAAQKCRGSRFFDRDADGGLILLIGKRTIGRRPGHREHAQYVALTIADRYHDIALIVGRSRYGAVNNRLDIDIRQRRGWQKLNR